MSAEKVIEVYNPPLIRYKTDFGYGDEFKKGKFEVTRVLQKQILEGAGAETYTCRGEDGRKFSCSLDYPGFETKKEAIESCHEEMLGHLDSLLSERDKVNKEISFLGEALNWMSGELEK